MSLFKSKKLINDLISIADKSFSKYAQAVSEAVEQNIIQNVIDDFKPVLQQKITTTQPLELKPTNIATINKFLTSIKDANTQISGMPVVVDAINFASLKADAKDTILLPKNSENFIEYDEGKEDNAYLAVSVPRLKELMQHLSDTADNPAFKIYLNKFLEKLNIQLATVKHTITVAPRADELKPTDTKPPTAKPSEAKPGETKPSEQKPETVDKPDASGKLTVRSPEGRAAITNVINNFPFNRTNINIQKISTFLDSVERVIGIVQKGEQPSALKSLIQKVREDMRSVGFKPTSEALSTITVGGDVSTYTSFLLAIGIPQSQFLAKTNTIINIINNTYSILDGIVSTYENNFKPYESEVNNQEAIYNNNLLNLQKFTGLIRAAKL